MTELYKVLFAYDTDKEDELTLIQGETIRITSKDSPDWWLAQKIDDSEKSGLVPSNFIEKLSSEGMTLAIVIQDYLAHAPEELSLEKNRVVAVLDQNVAEGWWKGDLNGKTGIFPANHVELVEEGDHDKDTFKLASYGVKQGGIGSILAGGFNLKRASTLSNRASLNERPTLTNSPEVHPPSIPSKPRPSLIKPTDIKLENSAPSESAKNNGEKAMVLHDYKPENDDEVKLMRGEYVTVIDYMENDGWWKGTSESGATGIFPSNFVQILKEDKPPQRPARARPATVKTETASVTPTATESTGMARPPPVPVTTRPTSLLSNRESRSPASSVSSPPQPPRPTTTPPRPVTSPPIAARRTNTIMSPSSNSNDNAASNHGHKRIPSIPLMSPDLPPVSPVLERPTRPIPRPTSTTSSDSTAPAVPVRANFSMSPENSTAIHNMAKPPKVNFGSRANPAPVVPVRSPSTSRPCSINDVVDKGEPAPPLAPKRSMPPLPEAPSPAVSTERIKPPHPTGALPSTPPSAASDAPKEDAEEALDAKIRRMIKSETNKIRREFETRLEDERIERLKLQVELEELRASLN
ncbi:SH3 domain-containing protein [Parasitella parasitica]|nr:SH3 domain-containing protein [Parasitella parasitica]